MGGFESSLREVLLKLNKTGITQNDSTQSSHKTLEGFGKRIGFDGPCWIFLGWFMHEVKPESRLDLF